jgi:hypothetical protein
VRDLVRSQLDGTITMIDRHLRWPGERGTLVVIELPMKDPQPIGL